MRAIKRGIARRAGRRGAKFAAAAVVASVVLVLVLPDPALPVAGVGVVAALVRARTGGRSVRSMAASLGAPLLVAGAIAGRATVTGAVEPQAVSIWANSCPGAKTVKLCRAAKTLRTSASPASTAAVVGPSAPPG